MTAPPGLALITRPPDWTLAAACTDPAIDPAWWHSDQPLQQAAARAICANCPVRIDCAIDALTDAEPYGIRGGLTPHERRTIAPIYGYPRPGAARHGTRSRYVAGCTAGPDGRACRPCLRAHAQYEHARRLRPPRSNIIRLGTIHRPRAPRRISRPAPAGQLQLIPA